MQTINMNHLRRLDGEDTIIVPRPGFKLPLVLRISAVVQMAGTFRDLRTYTVDDTGLQLTWCFRTRTGCRVWAKDDVSVGLRGRSWPARYEGNCAVGGAELAETLFICVRQDQAEMSAQAFVVLEWMVGVGDVEQKFPGLRWGLLEVVAAIVSVETVIRSVTGKRHNGVGRADWCSKENRDCPDFKARLSCWDGQIVTPGSCARILVLLEEKGPF